MTIKILGSCCKNCTTLEENAKTALTMLSIKADVIKISDYAEISKYGVMSLPGLVIDEKVVSFGKVLKPNEIAAIIQKVAK